MDISRINRIIFISFFALFSCNTKEIKNCDMYVSAGEGFFISFKNYSKKIPIKDLKSSNIQIGGKHITYTQENELGKNYLYLNNFNISLSEKVLLKDTLIITIKNKSIKIYDFTNITEEGFDDTHDKVTVCRYSTSKINGHKMDDGGNNIIVIDFDKLKL